MAQGKIVQDKKSKIRKLLLEFFGSDRGLTLKTWWLDKYGNKDAVFASESESVVNQSERNCAIKVLTRGLAFLWKRKRFLYPTLKESQIFSHEKNAGKVFLVHLF